jgi:hypothetical protein
LNRTVAGPGYSREDRKLLGGLTAMRQRGHDESMSTLPSAYPPPMPGGGYALRTVVVVDDLGDLRGPLEGKVRLPLHLEASDRALYDLSDEHRRELLYELVLLEAGSVEDLITWLDGDELIRMWPRLYLPRVVRAAWEARHPALRQRGASLDATQS